MFMTIQFFAVYLLLQVMSLAIDFLKSNPMFVDPLKTKLIIVKMSFQQAADTVVLAPMLCILFIGARMRALQIDPKNGAPQKWAQTLFYVCAYGLLVGTCLCLLNPIFATLDDSTDPPSLKLSGAIAMILGAVRFLLIASLVCHATATTPKKNRRLHSGHAHDDNYVCQQHPECPSNGRCEDGGIGSEEPLCGWGDDCDDCGPRTTAHLKDWWDDAAHWFDVDWNRYAPDQAHFKDMQEKQGRQAPSPDKCLEPCHGGGCTEAEMYACTTQVSVGDFCAHHPLVGGCEGIWEHLVTCETFSDDATTAHMNRAICAKKATPENNYNLYMEQQQAIMDEEQGGPRKLHEEGFDRSQAPVHPVEWLGLPAGVHHWDHQHLTDAWTSVSCRAAKIPEGVSDHDLVAINAYATAIGEPACPSDHFLALPNPYLPPCMCQKYGAGVFDTVEGVVDAFHDGTTMCVKLEEMKHGDQSVYPYYPPYGTYLDPFRRGGGRKLSSGHTDEEPRHHHYEETRMCYLPHHDHAKPQSHHNADEHGNVAHHDDHGHHVDEEHAAHHIHGWEYNKEGCRSDASTCAHVHTCKPYFMHAHDEIAGAECPGGPTNLHPSCTFHCAEGYEFEWGADTYEMGCEFDGDFHRCDLGGWCDWPEPPRCNKKVELSYSITDEDGKMCDPEYGEYRILTREECSNAAKALELEVTEAKEYPTFPMDELPGGCYWYKEVTGLVSRATALVFNPERGQDNPGGLFKDRSVICHRYVWQGPPNEHCDHHPGAIPIRDEGGILDLLDVNLCAAAAHALGYEDGNGVCGGENEPCWPYELGNHPDNDKYMEWCYQRDPPYPGLDPGYGGLFYNYRAEGTGEGTLGPGETTQPARRPYCHLTGPVHFDGPSGHYDPLYPMNLWPIYGDALLENEFYTEIPAHTGGDFYWQNQARNAGGHFFAGDHWLQFRERKKQARK